jgi:DNA-binding Xre family transcriptional regulator
MSKQIKVNLAFMRALRGKLTQTAISEATGIGQKTLSALETGASKGIEFGTLAKLCAYLHCTPNDLLVLEEIPDLEPPTAAAMKKAEELIARGLQKAMESPKKTPEEIWAEFDALRAKMQSSVQNQTPNKRDIQARR